MISIDGIAFVSDVGLGGWGLYADPVMPLTPPMPDRDVVYERRIIAFSFFWALATLNHQNYQGRLVNLDWPSSLDFVTLFVLLRPSSRHGLLVLAATQLLILAIEMPVVPNHWLLMGAANLGLILWIGPAWSAAIRVESRAPSRARLR